MQTLKPGTRCECWGGKCPHPRYWAEQPVQCESTAVRAVAVFVPTVPPDPRYPNVPATGRYVTVPMCDACARFHAEGKADA